MCVIVVFFFWYWILMSSNTPQNLETPILGSKIKRLRSSRQVSASDCGWLTDVSADDATCRGKPALNCIKSQKTQRQTEARQSPPWCKRRASTSKKKKKKLLLTVKTNHEWRKRWFFQCYCEKHDVPPSTVKKTVTGVMRSCRSTILHSWWVRVRVLKIRSGELSSSVWGTVPAVGRLFFCWNSLRHCVSFDRPMFFFCLFFLSTASLCSLGQQKNPPHLMTKVCPPKKERKKKKKTALNS